VQFRQDPTGLFISAVGFPLILKAMTRQLSLLETRVLGTLYEKQHTVPDSYPLTLNALVSGCNQKTSRSPVMEVTEAEVQAALDSLKSANFVMETSGSRVARYSHNVERGASGSVAIGRHPHRADAGAARRPPASCASTASGSQLQRHFRGAGISRRARGAARRSTVMELAAAARARARTAGRIC
jgi:hypothetical protein